MLDGITERHEHGLVILGPRGPLNGRRVLFVNNYGGADVWERIKLGLVPAHHLWGCLELARAGYEVALAEAVPDFNWRRRALPHDLTLLRFVRGWLRKDDIVYCGHNVLFWIPFLRSLHLYRRHIVSLLFAREPLDFAGAHRGVIALTPVAMAQAALLAPKAKRVHLGWGVDLNAYPTLPYRPNYLLHCGIAGRDFRTLHAATQHSTAPVRLIAAWPLPGVTWPKHVEIVDGGRGFNHEEKKVTFPELVNVHYASAAASLIVTIANPKKDHALGFTNLIEALALSRPIIQTRTGALEDEIDVEKTGCGISIPPEDPIALAHAMERIMREPEQAQAMGRAGRELCESHYNMPRYASELNRFFADL